MEQIALLGSLAVLAYIYAGYPILLELIVWIRGAKKVRKGDALCRVSLVISAYNEARVIAAKLENALAIDYPADLFEIVVVSDESSVGTDAIVASFTDPRVKLSRPSPRRGKTAGVNAVSPTRFGSWYGTSPIQRSAA